MTEAEIRAVMRGIAPSLHEHMNKLVDAACDAIKQYVDKGFAQVLERFTDTESRLSTVEAKGWAGIWDETRQYSVGQWTTYQGSLWHCDKPNLGSRPGGPGGFWRMSVKSGSLQEKQGPTVA